MTPPQAAVDLNADVGEGSAGEADLVPLVSSANVCCGRHAGDLGLAATVIGIARRHGVAVGAHPGHADREGFGRREVSITPPAAAALVAEQISALWEIAGGGLHHVKLHGGLYHQVGRDVALAEAVARLLADRWSELVVYAPSGSVLARIARGHGLVVAEEAFVDRGYRPDGSLVPRGEPGAAIDDPAEAAARAVRLVRDRVVRSVAGDDIPVAADTLCIHGDGPRASMLARAVREALQAAGMTIRAVAARRPPA